MSVSKGWVSPVLVFGQVNSCWVWIKWRLPDRRPLFVLCLPAIWSFKLWRSSSTDPTACGDFLETFHALHSDLVVL